VNILGTNVIRNHRYRHRSFERAHLTSRAETSLCQFLILPPQLPLAVLERKKIEQLQTIYFNSIDQIMTLSESSNGIQPTNKWFQPPQRSTVDRPSPAANVEPDFPPPRTSRPSSSIKQENSSHEPLPSETGLPPPSKLPRLGPVVLNACLELHGQLQECIVRGTLWEKATLCQAQASRFWRCAEDYKVLLLGFCLHYDLSRGFHRCLIPVEVWCVRINSACVSLSS
jgi:hypothetical protein